MKKLICAALVALMLLSVLCGAVAEEGREYRFTFGTTDVDGKAVTSAELYAGNKYTMLNFWATWCPPCIGELGELAEIHSQLQEMGCGVVGILLDDDFEKAHALMAENGTNYPVLVPSEDMYGLLGAITSIPTTIFVDGNGALVGTPIVGAYPEAYLSMARELMDGGTGAVD